MRMAKMSEALNSPRAFSKLTTLQEVELVVPLVGSVWALGVVPFVGSAWGAWGGVGRCWLSWSMRASTTVRSM